MKIATGALCMLAITAAGLPVAAHDHATGVVKERMEMMELMAKRMKAIREQIDGKRDLAAIKADAEAIASHAPHMVHLFRRGALNVPQMRAGRSGRTGRTSSARPATSKPRAKSLRARAPATLARSAPRSAQ